MENAKKTRTETAVIRVIEPRCDCRTVVIRAYAGLLESGVPELRALRAAERIYGLYHPEVPAQRAADTIAAWLRPDRVH